MIETLIQFWIGASLLLLPFLLMLLSGDDDDRSEVPLATRRRIETDVTPARDGH